MAKSYNSLSLEDRKKIEKLYKLGMSKSNIAKELDRSYSTIFREMQRCQEGMYDAAKAHAQAQGIKKEKYEIVGKINANYKPLTLKDRCTIEEMAKAGKKNSEIAFVLNKSVRTISRELSKCPEGMYDAHAVQNASNARRKEGCKKRVMTRAEKQEVEYKKIIKACIKLNPLADAWEIKTATGMPIERVEKYYDEIHRQVTKKV